MRVQQKQLKFQKLRRSKLYQTENIKTQEHLKTPIKFLEIIKKK